MDKTNPFERAPFANFRQICLGGLNLSLEPQDIADNESPDMRNISFTGGMIGPRPGTTLKLAKPSGESNDALQLIKAKDSRGNDYLIAVFGNHFYLFDPVNVSWIKLNGSYTPTSLTLRYAYANWNRGTGSDAFYFGNGTDDTMKWNQCLSYLVGPASPADTTITVSDASGFPSSGTLALYDGSMNQLTLGYSSVNVSTGVITLSGTVGATLASGQPVTVVILDMSGMPKGKNFLVSAPQIGVRLFIANNKGNESTVYFSKSTSQEDFGSTADTTTGGTQQIIDGEGPIIDMVDFGQFVMVVKKNAFTNLYGIINTTTNTLTMLTTPMVYGESIEPISHDSAITIENSYVYPTKTQGIYQLTPAMTGTSTSTNNVPFADKLLAIFNDPNFSFRPAHSEFYGRKLYMPASNVPGVNNLLLVRDYIYGAWSVWDGFNAVDIYEAGGSVYFVSHDDGGLYYIDITSNQDFRSGQPFPYATYVYTKRFDLGSPAYPKQTRFAYLQGYITENTKLYIDVIFNEGGSLAAATYTIDGSNMDYVQQVPVFGIGRVGIGLNPIGGAQKGSIGVFRVYLDMLYNLGAHVVYLKAYTANAGDNWGVTGLSLDPEVVENPPPQLIIGVS